MTSTRKILTVAVALLLGAGMASAQVDFSNYVALGDSLTAGYASAGLAKMYQDYSYPAILFGQFGNTGQFWQPIISNPGIPPVLELKMLAITPLGVSPVIQPKPTPPSGAPVYASYSGIYNNLGIPGAKTGDLLTQTGDISKVLSGNIDPNTIMYDLILRFPVFPGTTTPAPAIAQAIAEQGTFYTVWIGNNDVLGAAISGVALEGVTLTPKDVFQQEYTTLLGALRQARPNAGIMVATVPDVTAIPFVTTIKPYIVNPADGSHIPLIGESGLLQDGDYVTLAAASYLAQGIGIPQAAGGTGQPLPEGSIDATGLHPGVILRAAEIAAIRARTGDINGIINAVAAGVNAKVIDINAIFNDIVANGRTVGGVKLTSTFLTGGIFSYDGIHPQNLGYALVANEFVKAINAAYNTNLPQVNLNPYLFGTIGATSVMAGNTVFSFSAWKQLLHAFVPAARTDGLEPGRPVRHHVAREDRTGRRLGDPTAP